jgi:hypothetical protein
MSKIAVAAAKFLMDGQYLGWPGVRFSAVKPWDCRIGSSLPACFGSRRDVPAF